MENSHGLHNRFQQFILHFQESYLQRMIYLLDLKKQEIMQKKYGKNQNMKNFYLFLLKLVYYFQD